VARWQWSRCRRWVLVACNQERRLAKRVLRPVMHVKIARALSATSFTWDVGDI
jgi:hypothetical protein